MRTGKTIFISGGMHGNEINGIQLVQQFIHSLELNKLKGTIIIIPVLNPSGYHTERRNVQLDDKDLNRSFPGNKTGSPSSRIAHSIMENIVSKCEFGIDCHDSGSQNVLLPHPRVHVNKSGVCNRGCTLELGSVFGTDLILKRQGRDGMLAIEANKKYSIPILTVEIGGAFVIWPSFINEGVRGIKNLLSYNYMRKEEIILPKRQFVLNYRDNYKAPAEGILRLRVRIGDAVDKGCLLAEVHNPVEEGTRYIRSKECGVIFATKLQSKVVRHEGIISMLNFKTCNISKSNIKNAQLIRNRPKKGLIKLRKSLLFEKATKLKS